jgi:hypothetical protein
MKPDNQMHVDLAAEIHALAWQRMAVTKENYSSAVKWVLAQDSAIRTAYAASTSANTPPREKPAAPIVHKDVSDYVVERATKFMVDTGEKSIAKAAEHVLAADPELRQAYAQFTCSRK